MVIEFERELRHTWMILEFEKIYEEDYQMKMLTSNSIPGLLMIRGQGTDERSRYRYEISGKISMKTLGEKEGWSYSQMEEFMRQLIQVLKEMDNYLLDVNCLSLNPECIFWKEGIYYFCYCPALEQDLWMSFHELSEYFVKETNYEDKDAIYFAYELHKSSMEDNYNIEVILEKILERKEKEMERIQEQTKEMSYELEEEQVLDAWALEQGSKHNILREKPAVWGFVSRKLQRNNKD